MTSNKKRIVFHNPHTEIWYKLPLYHYLTKRKSVRKNEYLFDKHLLNNGEVDVLIDGYGTSFPYRKLCNRFFAFIEFYLWCRINKVPYNKMNIIKNVTHLNKSDVLFSYLYGNLTSLDGRYKFDQNAFIQALRNTTALKAFHCTHYFYNIATGAKNAEAAGIDVFVSENNLFKNSKFFQKFFTFYNKDVITLPFVPGARFKNYKPFKDRQSKAFATGTITYPISDPNFIEFFKTPYVQPMRVEIYNNQDKLTSHLDSYIMPIEENKPLTSWKSKFLNQPVIKQIHSSFFVKQVKYFSFNMVEKFNDYKMFIVPEEVNDLPGIGFAEGMMCGSVFIGIDDPMYTDLGMIPGKHYITYDGTLQGLTNCIDYYQQHEQELEAIAIEGCKLALKAFNPDVVYQNFLATIQNYHK